MWIYYLLLKFSTLVYSYSIQESLGLNKLKCIIHFYFSFCLKEQVFLCYHLLRVQPISMAMFVFLHENVFGINFHAMDRITFMQIKRKFRINPLYLKQLYKGICFGLVYIFIGLCNMLRNCNLLNVIEHLINF